MPRIMSFQRLRPTSDASRFEQMIQDALSKAAMADLDDAYPEWREITGAPTDDRPYIDVTVPFRKWLSGKDGAYQRRVNHTVSASILIRAIERFGSEHGNGSV